ncbi:MAG TPA: hypothetical protein VG841_05860 [Caulobacterales bacterium]|nr:hypothetical protein [Caulobacterales bacterium]
MRTTFALLSVAALLAACAAPGQIRNMTHGVNLHGYKSYSWGKAGVSFEAYREVVFECTARGVLSQTDVKPDIDVMDAGASEDQILQRLGQIENAQQREDMRQRHEIIDNCLVEFGFRRFGLTDEQLARLDTLPRGSLERQRYLHSLGSDGEILRRQHLAS